MNAMSKIDTIITAIEEQTEKALSHLGKENPDILDLPEAVLALENIKERLPGLREAIDEAREDAREAALKAEWHCRR